jgi:hypothetical protein
MAINIKVPSLAIASSTTTANGQLLPVGNQSLRYVLVTNNSATSGCYVNAGGSGVTATSANICLAPFETRLMERDPTTDAYVAALLQSGTATITACLVGGPD